MKIIRSLVAFLFSIIMVTSSVSCAPRTLIASTKTPEPTQSATPSASPTATLSTTPTVVPTPATDEFGFTEERRAELNQQFQDFLNYQGKYSEENIQEYLLPAWKSFYGLGLVGGSDDYYRVQTWLFDYVEKDGDLILLTGFDGKGGQRFVTALNIPLHLVEIKPEFGGVLFMKFDNWAYRHVESTTNETSTNFQVIESRLSKDRPLLVGFVVDIVSDEEVRSLGGDDRSVTINQYYRDGVLYANDLVSKIINNGKGPYGDPNKEVKQIQEIKEISDVSGLDNNRMPVVNYIVYVG